ncbi:hypothetical protein FEV13_00395 (plasmid) [Stutzerimonas degradans]|nr:hypothetical protein FEV13_00395 [Stutzerimonas degradans]
MSITRTIEIQRSLNLDEKSMVILRNFDIDWKCGTRFIVALINSGVSGVPLANALSEALFDYKIMCQLGVSDYERLYYVLDQLFAKLKNQGVSVPTETVSSLCQSALVPDQIREQLING